MEKIYTVKETSKILKTNTNFVYDLIKNNKLKSVKIGSTKILESDLQNYLKNLNKI